MRSRQESTPSKYTFSPLIASKEALHVSSGTLIRTLGEMFITAKPSTLILNQLERRIPYHDNFSMTTKNMEQPDRMKEWAENLINQPVGVNDDYGNLIVSLGIALQQQPQETQDPAVIEPCDPPSNAVEQQRVGDSGHKPSMIIIRSQILEV